MVRLYSGLSGRLLERLWQTSVLPVIRQEFNSADVRTYDWKLRAVLSRFFLSDDFEKRRADDNALVADVGTWADVGGISNQSRHLILRLPAERTTRLWL
jgi:hypothetical protein